MDFENDTVDFGKQAFLRKWPSLDNQRRTNGTGPYLLMEGSLDDCIRELMEKPGSTRHLYEILIDAQLPSLTTILEVEQVRELVRLPRFSLRDD